MLKFISAKRPHEEEAALEGVDVAVTEKPVLLTTAAALLLGAALPAQAGPIIESEGEYQLLKYNEKDNRISVEEQSAHLKHPLSASAELEVTAVLESLSGASPQFVTNPDGTAIEVLSNPSITESRRELDLKYSHYAEDTTISIGNGYSDENDYRSRSLNLGINQAFNQKNTLLSFGAGHSSDQISATNQPALQQKRSTNNYLVGVTQTISPTLILQSNLSYATGHGYYSDPYKFTMLFNPEIGPAPTIIADQRPTERKAWAWLFSLRKYFPELGGSLSSDYRHYLDDWGVYADTIDLSWNKDSSGPWSTQLSFRYHTQGDADFYFADQLLTPVALGQPFSTDHRLAAFGAITPGIQFSRRVDAQLQLNIDLQYYRQSNSLQFSNKGNQLESVEATIFALSLQQKF